MSQYHFMPVSRFIDHTNKGKWLRTRYSAYMIFRPHKMLCFTTVHSRTGYKITVTDSNGVIQRNISEKVMYAFLEWLSTNEQYAK